MGFADTMMVGRYSTDALAAASFVNNLFTLVAFLMMGYSYGLTPLVSAHYGRGEKIKAGGVLKRALAANGVYGSLLIVVMAVRRNTSTCTLILSGHSSIHGVRHAL